MTDREILDKYIDLDKSCLTRGEKEEVRELLYEYKDIFSLRDEMGTCPYIEVEIDVTWTKLHSLSDHIMQKKRTNILGQGNEESYATWEF